MATLADLPRILKASAKRRQVPGAVVGVLRNDRIVATAAAGVINLDTQVPTTDDTVFQIGSISKIFTTTLIMQLVDERRLDLDAPITTYLPEFRTADISVSSAVTARHFLAHISGIDGDLFVDAGRGDDAVARLVDKATMVPSLFPIGAKHSYCNLGFAVLGRVAEVITGRTYDALLKERIFEPLKMQHAISLPEDSLRFRCAIGHVPSTRRKDVWYVSKIPYLTHGQKAAGSTPAMSVTDLLRFARMHMNHGRNGNNRVLSARSARAMLRRQIKLQRHTNRGITHWGLGWFLMDWNGQRLHGHDGATIGQFASLRILPKEGLAVAILTNGGDATGLFQDLYRHIFGGLARTSEPATPEPDPDLQIDPERYCGRYANILTTYEITQARHGLRIRGRANGGADTLPRNSTLALIDANTAVLRSGNPILDRQLFLFSDPDAAGRLQFMASGLRQLRRL